MRLRATTKLRMSAIGSPSASHCVEKFPPLLYRPSSMLFSCKGEARADKCEECLCEKVESA